MADNYTPLRWGILGAGSIARRVGNDVTPLSDHTFQAVGSRDKAKADKFGDEFSIPNRHDSYEALVNDPEVDLIYVATPHNFHKEHTLLALNAGKAVLCEKPFTINASEAQVLVDAARQKNLFLMEGMWSRCFPAMHKMRELLRDGAIGDPLLLQADFGFRAGVNPDSRLFNPALGGGGLMDVGVYPVALAFDIFGSPSKVAGVAHIGSTGVDEVAGMLLGYESGAIATLSTGIRVNTPQVATLIGSEGKIVLPGAWWCPKSVILSRNGKDTETFDFDFERGGFQFEAAHVAECLRAGKTESDLIPLDQSLEIMKTLDTLREQMGVKYPME